MKTIEEQPLPLPLTRPARPVSKYEDGASDADGLLADPGALSLLAIKLAQRRAC